MNISYEDALKLLCDIDDDNEYRDYVLYEDKIRDRRVLIGGAVGKHNIIKNLLRHRDELQIPNEEYFNVDNICHGITYIENYDDNRNDRIFVPVDYNKLQLFLTANYNA
jgi:hypothetical protein